MCGGQGPPSPLDPWRAQNTTAPRTLYSTELHLLAHVLAMAHEGDPAFVCEAFEDFDKDVLGSFIWIGWKVVGGIKAEVLSAALCSAPARGGILEIGTYCGYSAIQMAKACPGVGIITLELDPAHIVVARHMFAIAGLAHVINVWTGHSEDLLH